MWATNSSSNQVTKLRASDGATVGVFPANTNPIGIAFDGENIWVSNYDTNTVTKLRGRDGSIAGVFMVDQGPIGLAFDGANIWSANTHANQSGSLEASTAVRRTRSDFYEEADMIRTNAHTVARIPTTTLSGMLALLHRTRHLVRTFIPGREEKLETSGCEDLWPDSFRHPSCRLHGKPEVGISRPITPLRYGCFSARACVVPKDLRCRFAMQELRARLIRESTPD